MMRRLKEASIYWQRPYGWRAGPRDIEPQATAADVITFEREGYGNNLDVPDFFMNALVKQQIPAKEVIWVCRTRQHARRYSGGGNGQPYKEDFGPNALILATDHEPETGYLVLKDASLLDPAVIVQYADYRRKQYEHTQEPETRRFPHEPK